MKTLSLLIAIFCIQIGVSQNYTEDISGHWTIDLRPTPEAEGYYQKIEITQVNDKTFNGTFYGSTIENALINKQWKGLYFAFITKDGSNTYYHSGYVLDGKIYGISFCPKRAFTAPWTGIKEKE